jgi:TolB-like protein/Flp pilus assembly protein TadD
VNAVEPSAAEIRAELAHVLAGAGFARNVRMSRFLAFLVDRHLEGRDEELKESLIAHEVFGRRPDYDPKRDSIVRTEAARLRGRLAEHYAGAGRHSSVILDIPKGSYVPVFRYREVPIVEAAPPATRRLQLRGLLAGVLCGAVLLGGAAWWSLHGQHAPIPIAVLPLVNLGHDSSGDPFADGLTGELVTQLSVIEGLAVRSRASSLIFTDRARDTRDIGPKLGVDYLIDGSVMRAGSEFQIDVRLVSAGDGAPVWSGHFDRPIGDIFEVEDEIALAIVNNLRLRLGRGRRRYETSVAAYDDYLGARAIRFGAGGPESYADRISRFERALGKDPAFAPAYAGLALAYANRSVQFPLDHPPDELTKLRAAANKAVQIDPLLTEAYEALAMADARDAHWRTAEQEFRHAIETDPHNSRTRAEFAFWLLAVLGRSGEAIEQARLAEIDDPLATDVQIASAFSLMEAGRYQEAETHCAKLPADNFLRPQCLGRARLGEGRISDAIATLRAAAEAHFNPQTLGFLGYALARTGQREEAQQMVADPKGTNEEALIYAGLGDKGRTIDAIERMAARGAQRAGQYLYSPELSSLLAGDPRLPALRKKIGLPE